MAASSTRPSGRYKKALIYILLLLLLAALGWYFFYTPDGPAKRAGFGMSGMAIPVGVARAETGQLDRVIQALGTVTPVTTVNVRARVDGPLLQLYFQDGQKVNQGDLLAQIDPEPYAIKLEQALGQQTSRAAQLQIAQADLARYERLFRQDSIASQQLETARAKVLELQGQARSDQAAVEDARLELSYTKIHAPAAGTLGFAQVDVGNLIRAADADGLVVLTQSDPIDVVFAIPQGQLHELLQARQAQPELPVYLFSDNPKNVLAQGSLRAIDNQVDSATGTVRLKAGFANQDEALFPNQFVRVRLRLGVQDGVLVPLRAVQRGTAGQYVYRLGQANKVSVVPVTTGVDDGSMVIIESGLEAGDQVVIEGADRLRSDSLVEIVRR